MTMSSPLKAGPASTARYTCHCGKSFARKEHRTRHQATHDKLAYICNVCQRQFSRKDLLRRHSNLHLASHKRIVVSCNACRANKTKCSGGTQCSLCSRRGINCTLGSDARQSKIASPSDGSTAANAPVSDNDDNDDAEESAAVGLWPEIDLAENRSSAEGELLASTIEFFQNLTIAPSKPASTSDFRPPKPLSFGIEAVYDLLVAERPSLEEAMGETDELPEWITKYFKAFVKNCHLRWPILSAPTFDIRTASLPLAASVCVIGASFQSSDNWTERLYALRMHDILLQHLLHKLMDFESMFAGKKWPIELFQAVLLTLIFSLYRTDKSALSKAMLLRSTFIVLLRDLGAFNFELLTAHLKTHINGSYTPYMLSIREKFKRVLALTFQFDAYFALAHEMPPILHRQEVGVELPTTFGLWNTYGLEILAKRMPDEPPGRGGCQVSEMTAAPDAFPCSQLLVEDVQLGLCGVLPAIWVLKQSFPSKTRAHLSNASQRDLLMETLDAWKHELDKISVLADAKNITANPTRKLLLAYRGEDDHAVASLERITTLLQDGMVLYYYLKMTHHTGANACTTVELEKLIEETHAETWRTSKAAREALVCALQLLKMASSIGAPDAAFNPLMRHALARALNVARAVVPCQECECLAKESQSDATMDFQRWAEVGGYLRIDGTPVCTCKLEFWIESFQNAIRDQKMMVE